MTNRSRVRWSLAAAFLAHVAMIAWAGHIKPPVSSLRSGPPQSLEIEVAAEPEPAPAPPPPAATDAPPVTPPPVAVATREVARPSQPGAPPSSSPTSDEPVVTAAPGGSAAWTFSPTVASAQPPADGPGSEADVALRKATVAGVGVVVAEAAKKAAARARKPLMYTPHDMDLGLVPGAQYASIARQRVRSSLVPANGHALLEFWTDSKGVVARVRVLGAAADTAAWDEVANELVEDARATYPLKVPSNADGLIITMDVTSVMRTLSGASETSNPLVTALRAVQNPIDSIMDAKGGPQRIVAARVVGIEAF